MKIIYPKGSVPIEYHADDFGLFPKMSMRILDCSRKGSLNGVSILPNGRDLPECMALLQDFYDRIAVTVHLNLIEGPSVCPGFRVPALTDKKGNLRSRFGVLLLRSFLPGRRKLLEQIKLEFAAQIRAVKQFLPEGTALRLDSHAHYHMVPVVFDALMEVIREEKLEVSYLRIPREYPMLYLRNWGRLQDVSVLNFVKVLVLNCLAVRNGWKYRSYLSTVERKLFLGVFLSGRMYRQNVEPLMEDAMALAEKLGQGLEILAHPGGVYEEEDIARLTCREDVDFLTSSRRRAEATLYQMEY